MYLLGIDLGSSSVKVALVDSMSGRCVAQDYYPKIEAPIKALQAGWAEQSPADWVGYFKLALGSVLESSRINAADIAAIGISYQMHSLVAVDRAGRLLRDAIIWCDSRGVPYGEKAFADLGADTCLGHLLNSPGNFTAAKLKWVKENEPQVFDSIYKVMLPGDYLALLPYRRDVYHGRGPVGNDAVGFLDRQPGNFPDGVYGLRPIALPQCCAYI